MVDGTVTEPRLFEQVVPSDVLTPQCRDPAAAAAPDLPRDDVWQVFKPRRLASTAERKLAAVIAVFLVVFVGAMAPLANRPLLVVPGFIAAYSTILIILNFLIAQLLVYKARIENDGNRMNLAVAFFFCGIVSTLHLLAFPGGLMPGIIIGTAQSAPWLWVFWYGGFALFIIGYYARARPDGFAPSKLRQAAAVCLSMLAAIGYFAFAGARHLPPSLLGDVFFPGVDGLAVKDRFDRPECCRYRFCIVQISLSHLRGYLADREHVGGARGCLPRFLRRRALYRRLVHGAVWRAGLGPVRPDHVAERRAARL